MNKFILIAVIPFIFISGCAHKTPVTSNTPTSFSWLQSTKPDSAMTGKASFWSTPEGVKIRIVVTGATPGLHAVHVHENGDCSDAGNAAGGHFNPDKAQHGDVAKDGFKHAHPGDLGNIAVDSTGLGSTEVFVEKLTLDHAHYGIAGRSVVVHEKADDFGQPTGNAGGRVACAIIPGLLPPKAEPAKVAATVTPPQEAAPKRKRSPWLLWLR